MIPTTDPLALSGFLAAFHAADIPLFIWGPPGAGKSAVVAQYAAAAGMDLCDVRLSQYESVDLRGIPVPDEPSSTTRWFPPSTLPFNATRPTLLFLDEILHAQPSVQAVAFQLVLDRRVGEHRLPPHVYIVAASNRHSDKAGVNQLLAPLANRFAHVEVTPTLEAWKAWALKPETGISPLVVGYLNQRPSHLDLSAEAIKQGLKAFPTPRAWEGVSRILRAAPPCMQYVEALIGSAVAGEFMAYAECASQLPQWEDITSAPAKARVPDSIDALYAVASLCVARVATETVKAVTTYVKRLPLEYQTLFIADLARARRSFVATSAPLSALAGAVWKEVG